MAAAKIAFKLWGFFGIGNACYIGYVCYIFPENRPYLREKCNKSDDIIFNCVGRSLHVIAVFAKAAFFGSMGPIGTYRIGLAHYNKWCTGDNTWTDAIHCMGAYDHSKYFPYITKPFGKASWWPVSRERIITE